MKKLVIRFEPFEHAIVAQLLEKTDPFAISTQHISEGNRFTLRSDSIALGNVIGDIAAINLAPERIPKEVIKLYVDWISTEYFEVRTPCLGEKYEFSEDKETWITGFYAGALSDKIDCRFKYLDLASPAGKSYKAYPYVRAVKVNLSIVNNIYTWEQE